MTDDELLALVQSERRRSVGFDNDSDLVEDRERALNYMKGDMSQDVPSLPNRSSATTSDINDAIETILPDLVEIFTGGDEVATFIPRGQEDEEGAEQESDYVNHVVFNENDGWLTLYTALKDALSVKTGVFKWWWEDCEPEEEILEGRNLLALESITRDGAEIVSIEPAEGYDETSPEQLVNVTIRKKARGKLCVEAWPPEDFTVAADTTIRLQDATYCAARSRPRAQELIAQGIAADKVAMLSTYATATDDAVAVARDTVEENQFGLNGASDMLRTVEVVEHYIRVLDGKKLKLWRVLTGENESVLLDKEEVNRIQYAAITPYIVTHRFYGKSVADLLIDVQKVSTALTRMMLDSGYFGLNQRMVVAESEANANTIPDLLNNQPGMPIRAKTSTAVQPVRSAGLTFDVLTWLEYMKTVAEQRTGIVRAAQGLTPDTMHETAKGALAMLTQAQKRVRLIARIFAETGIKDMFLGVHALLRQHADQQSVVRLRNKWVEVSPTSWGERSDMNIEIGVGAAGKEAEMQALQTMAQVQQAIIAGQGGPGGPLVNVENVYNLSRRMFEKLGAKAPDKYISDPKNAGPPPPPKPDPKMVEAEQKIALEQQKFQTTSALDQQRAQLDAQTAQQKAQTEAELARYRAELDAQVARENNSALLRHKEAVAAAELDLKERLEMAKLEQAERFNAMRIQAGVMTANASGGVGDVEVGGVPG